MKPPDLLTPSLLIMKTLISIVFSVLVVCGEDTAWGPIKNELQLGVSIDSAREPTLRVIIRNQSLSVKTVLVGFEGHGQPLYSLHFQAKTPDGKLIQVLDRAALRMPPKAGLMIAKIIKINPESSFEMPYPLTELEGLPPLEKVHSIQVSFKGVNRTEEMGRSGPRSELWTGQLSAERILKNRIISPASGL